MKKYLIERPDDFYTIECDYIDVTERGELVAGNVAEYHHKLCLVPGEWLSFQEEKGDGCLKKVLPD